MFVVKSPRAKYADSSINKELEILRKTYIFDNFTIKSLTHCEIKKYRLIGTDQDFSSEFDLLVVL